MRYAFIVNPISGRGGHDRGIVHSIEGLIANHNDMDMGIYYTQGNKDAVELSKTLAEEASKAGDEIIVFACGGDGTAHEVANGIYGYDNAILGLIPVGSGNDLARELARGDRNFKEYTNLDLQMKGHPRKIDVMKLSWEDEGGEQSCIAVNGINIGFDGDTAVKANEIKTNSFLSGSLAYIAAVFSTLVKKIGQNLKITADGENFHEGPLLLATVSNGGYCGGGIRSCPFAILDDGELELMAIEDMSRVSFVSKFPKYRSGMLFEIKGVDNIVSYRRAKEIVVEPLADETMKFVADGETLHTGKVKIEIVPKAITVWEI